MQKERASSGRLLKWSGAALGVCCILSLSTSAAWASLTDSDGDGWGNEYEIRAGTDPLSSNSKPVSTNLVVNGGFEEASSWNGKTDWTWNYMSTTRSEADRHGGSRSLKATFNGVAGSSAQNFYQVQQVAPVNPALRYVLTYWMKTVNRAGGNTYSGMEIQALKANGTKACDSGDWCHSRAVGGTSQANTSWTCYRVPITFGDWPLATQLRVICRQHQNSGANGEIWYDDVGLWLDLDGDLMPDAWEVEQGLNPLVNDAQGDLDGDGLSNAQEWLNR